MTKLSVTYEEVRDVAKEMVEKGEWPTANSVRNHLRKGSYSTVQTYLSTWQNNFLRGKSGQEDIPDHVTDSFHSLYLEIEKRVSRRYDARIAALEEKNAILERDNEIMKKMLRAQK